MRLGVRNLAQGDMVSTALISWRHNINQSYPTGIVDFGHTVWQGNKESSWAGPGAQYGVISRKCSVISIAASGNAREHSAIREVG